MKNYSLIRIVYLFILGFLLSLTNVNGQFSITSNPTNATICQNSSITFTATNTGGFPLRWRKNSAVISGATSTTYSTTSLSNNNVIDCQRQVLGVWQTSVNSITVTVTTNVSPTLTISSNPSVGTNICSVTPVTFTATPNKPGNVSSYQWKVGTVAVAGANQSTYTTTFPAGYPQVTCVVTHNANACVTYTPVTSNNLSMTIVASTMVSVSIAPSVNPVCTGAAGTWVNFTATPVGPWPSSFQWKKNGVNITGATGSTYGANASTVISPSNLNNGDKITCETKVNGNCISGSPATSNEVVMQIPATPVITLSSTPSIANPICIGDIVTFNASYSTTGLTASSLEWRLGNHGMICAGNPCILNTSDFLIEPIFYHNDPVSVILYYTDACHLNSGGGGNFVQSNSILYNFNPPGLWRGIVSSDWHNPDNWCGKVVPTSTTDVIINSGAAHIPIISNNDALCKSITINNGASLQLNTYNLSVSGNWINNGTFTSNNGTNIFSGTTTISGSSAHSFNNVTITSLGNLTVPSLISVTGNWSNSGIFNNNNGLVNFTGAIIQSISGSNTFASLKIDKSTNSLTLNSPTTISSQLNLSLGKIITTSTNVLNLMDNATVTGASNTSFVEGPLRKTGDDAFVFPIGKGSFRPVQMSAPTTTTSAFTMEYFNSTPPNSSLTSGEALSLCEYWKVDQTSGSSTIQLTFNWNTNPCESIRESVLEVMRLPNTNPAAAWANVASIKNIPSKTVSVSNLSSFGYFTFGYKFPLNYAELTQKLDGGFYIADRSNLFIHYKEEYSNPSASFQLKYRILDAQRNVLTSNITNILNKQIGINQLVIPLSYCSYTDGHYYILEVTDEKNENSYLRFKYIKPALTIICP